MTRRKWKRYIHKWDFSFSHITHQFRLRSDSRKQLTPSLSFPLCNMQILNNLINLGGWSVPWGWDAQQYCPEQLHTYILQLNTVSKMWCSQNVVHFCRVEMEKAEIRGNIHLISLKLEKDQEKIIASPHAYRHKITSISRFSYFTKYNETCLWNVK